MVRQNLRICDDPLADQNPDPRQASLPINVIQYQPLLTLTALVVHTPYKVA